MGLSCTAAAAQRAESACPGGQGAWRVRVRRIQVASLPPRGAIIRQFDVACDPEVSQHITADVNAAAFTSLSRFTFQAGLNTQ